jgi:hypothetical protein
MIIRSLTSFSLVTVLALGLAACGDDGKPTLTTAGTATNTNTTNTTNNNTTTTDGTTTDDTATATETDGTDAGTATESTATETATSTPTTTEGPVTTTTTEGTTTDDTATTATATATTDDETTDGTTTGGGGGEYQACGPNNECPAGSDCLMLQGIEGNFCSPMCDGMTCPATGAAAMGVCALGMGMGDPTYCAAICPPGDDSACPEGTTCKEVPDQPNPVGICTAP